VAQQITTTLLASIQERRSLLAAAWQCQAGQPDAEQLRLALRQYRSFIGVVQPDPDIQPGTSGDPLPLQPISEH